MHEKAKAMQFSGQDRQAEKEERSANFSEKQ